MSIRLRRSGLVAGAIGGGVALATIGAGLAMAQPSEESLTVEPTSGEPGTTVSVSGANCDSLVAQVLLLHGDTQLDMAEAVVIPVVGTWTTTLDVPADDSLRGESLGVSAACVGGTTTYAPATFTVNTTTTTGPTTPSTDPTTPSTNPTTPSTQPPGQPGTSGPGATGTTPTTAPGGTTATTAPGTTPTPAAPSTPAAPTIPAEPNHSG